MANLLMYMTIQRREIEEHKYYLSKNAGKDVGFESAMFDWAVRHAERFNKIYFANAERITEECGRRCGHECGGIEKCTLTKEDIHQLLND